MLTLFQMPMATDFLKGREEKRPLPNNSKYKTALRKLLYLTTTTRTDITTAVGILSRKADLSAQGDWTAVQE